MGEEVRNIREFNTVAIATQNGFPDALTGAVLAAKKNSPIFLVNKDTVDGDVKEYIGVQPVEKIYVFGGTGVVTNGVINQIVE